MSPPGNGFRSSGSCGMEVATWRRTATPVAMALWLASICAMVLPEISAMRGPHASFAILSSVLLVGMVVAAGAFMLGEFRHQVVRLGWGPEGVMLHPLLGRPRTVLWSDVDQVHISPPETGMRERTKGPPDVVHLFVSGERRPYVLRTRWDAPMYQLVAASEQKTTVLRVMHPEGKRLPFRIRTQTDSKGGVALEVENRVGQPVTCAKLVNLDTMLLFTGKIIETSQSPLACRTQFAQSVSDAWRLFLNWGGGVIKGGTMTLLHRAVFYGDYMRPMQDLGDLMAFKVLEEGGA